MGAEDWMAACGRTGGLYMEKRKRAGLYLGLRLRERNVSRRIFALFLAVLLMLNSGGAAALADERGISASSQPYTGCVWLNIPGSYEVSDTLQQEILDEVNRIRYEACSEGLPNPDTGVPMTVADYQPVQWSSNLETVSLLRSVEAVQLIGHVRPCSGKSPLTMGYEDYPIGPNYECLAWNWSGMMAGISQWYAEKADYIETPGYSSNTGHYVAMIDPAVRYIGFSSYYSTAGSCRYSICGEFSMTTSVQDGTFLAPSEPENKNVSVKPDYLTSITITDTENHPKEGQLAPGETTALRADAAYAFYYNGRNYKGSGRLMEGCTWSSSDSSVATVSASGVVTAVSAGTAEITCSAGTASGSWTLTVDAIKETAALADIQTASGTAPVLPDSVSAAWLLGGTTTEKIIWESPLPENYKKRAGGSYTITGTLEDYPQTEVSVTVNVEKASVTAVTGYADQLVTESGTPPAFSPTAVLHWSNGEEEEVSLNWPELPREYYSQRSGGTASAQTTITAYINSDPYNLDYVHITIGCTVTVKPAMIVSVNDPEPIQTFTGHRPTGLPSVVTAEWSNGDESEESVTWSTIKESSYAEAGSFTLTGIVSHSSIPASLTIHVVDPKVTGIRWDETKLPASEYIQGQELKLVPGMLIADFEDGSTEVVDNDDLIITNYDPYTLGDQTVYFNYIRDGLHQQYLKVNVREKRLTGVSWSKLPDKLVYVVGQKLDLAGGEVELQFDDDSTEVSSVDNSMLSSVPELIWPGEMDLTFTYNDPVSGAAFPCPFKVTVVERNPVSVEVMTLPEKTAYVDGDPVNLAGGTLLITYNDDTTDTVGMTDASVQADSISDGPGDRTVRVYVLTTDGTEVSDEFTVHFREKRKVSVESATWIPGKNGALSVSCQDAELLQKVLLNGEELPAEAFTATADGVTLKEEYIKALPYGDHTLTFVWEDEVRTAGFQTLWPFYDVNEPAGAWYVEGIRYVYEKGIMSGLGKTENAETGQMKFGRSDPVRRCDFACIIYRMAGSPGTDGLENPFSDLKFKNGTKPYYYDAVLWCYSEGILSGFGDGTCRPGENVTRVQIAVLMRQYAAWKGEDVSGGAELDDFADRTKVPGWGRAAMQWAVQEGILSGKKDEKTGKLRLDAGAVSTRAECARMIMLFLER